MNERFREGFDRLLEEMPKAPNWEEVSAERTTPIAQSPRNRGPLVALAVGLAAVVMVGAVVGFVSGVFPSAGSDDSLDYVRIAWSQDVEMRCVGMEIVDNGGFDQAVIEIWGPNADGLVRVDATAPDGTVERLIAEVSASERGRVWFAHKTAEFEDQTVFHVSDCTLSSSGGSSSYSMADPPVMPFGFSYDAYLPIPTVLTDGTTLDLGALVVTEATSRPDTWRGIRVTVYERSDSQIDELGTQLSTRAIWFDSEAGRFERAVYFTDSEMLGRLDTMIEVVERGTVPVDAVSFSVEGLFLTREAPVASTPDEPSAVTSSIVPTAHPLMERAMEISVTDIPTAELRNAMDPKEGDQLFLVPAEDDGSLIVLLRAAARPRMYATSCAVLISVDLPEGWDGTCLERVVGGQLTTGEFSYAVAFR